MLQSLVSFVRWLVGPSRQGVAPPAPNPLPPPAGRPGPQPPPPPQPSLQQAYQAVFQPVHTEEQRLQLVQPQSGEIPTSSEEHISEDGALRTLRKESLVVTATGALVRAEALQGICQGCGQVDSLIFRCSQCGRVHCGRCIVRTGTPEGGEVAFCRVHALAYLENFDAWAALRKRKRHEK